MLAHACVFLSLSVDLSLHLCVGDAPALLDPLRACVGSANAHAYEGGSIGERTERKEASPPFRSVSKIKQIRGAPQARIFAERGLRMPGVREGVQHLKRCHARGHFCLQQTLGKRPRSQMGTTHATDWNGCGGGHGFRHGFRGGFVILPPAAPRILAGCDEGRAPFSSTTSATLIRRYAQATLTLNKQHRLDDAPATNTNTNTNTSKDEAHRRCSRPPCGRRLVRRHGRRVGYGS